MSIKDVSQGIQVNQRKKTGAIEVPKQLAATAKAAPPSSAPKTSAIDPTILEAANRLQGYAEDPNLARVREALDKVRTQFPEMSDQQWNDYLSKAPQLEVEKKAKIAAETVVKSATPEQQADAVKTSAKTQGTYTAEEILIYKDLKKKLPPEGQANLKKLLVDGQLLKQDAKNSGNLLHYLNGLASVNFNGRQMAEGAATKSVLGQVLQDIAHPEDIQQRLDVSCLGSAGQYDMAKNNPAEYSRVISELYTQKNDPSSKSDFANILGLEKVLENSARDGKFSGGFIEGVASFLEKKFPNASENAKKFIAGFRKAADLFVKGDLFGAWQTVIGNKNTDYAKAANAEIVAMATSAVSDVGFTFQVNMGKAGDKLGGYAKSGIFDNKGYYVDDKGKALDAVTQATGEGKSVYGVLKGEEAGHMVVIKEVKDGKVTFYDPESEGGKSDEQTLDASAFSDSFNAVFLPQGEGLSAIREDDTTPIWGRGSKGGTRR